MRRKHVMMVLCVMLLAGAAQADRVTLTTGEVLKGKITAQGEAGVTLEHPVLGVITVPRDGLKDAATDAQIAEAERVEAERVAAENARLLGGWDSQFDVGLNATDGNSEAATLYLAFVSKKETPTERWELDSAYRYAQKNGESTANRFTVGLVKDWKITDSLWFYFADLRYDWDQFQDWDARLAGHAGVGYDLVKTDSLDVELRGGFGGLREFGSSDDSIKPEALAGVEAEWRISENQSLEAKSTYYPDLDETGEFRTLSHVDWKLKLNRFEKTSIKVGLKHEHQSEVDPGSEKNDWWYYAALSIGF